ncbi:MAG: tripartite tricarboxylate transporter permease [Halobacteriaceae archaeon]
MLLFGARVFVAPGTAAAALAFVAAGVALGTASGLCPGLHVNNLALLLAAAAPSIPGPPHLVGATLLAAGVVHSFLDVVPALALGVPDASMAVTALPGHRLVIAGRGREAIRLSALGSAAAVALAAPLAVPMTRAMATAYPVVEAHLSVALGCVVAFLVLTERGTRARAGALCSLAVSGALGLVVLDADPTSILPTGDVLAPLFAGLFGAPVLLDAMDGGGVPPQGGPTIVAGRRSVGLAAGAGTLAGAVVAYVPGISSAIAAAAALAGLPDAGDREFVVATSGVNTANTIFALFALVSLGSPRTGLLVALDRAAVPLNLPLLLVAIALGACAGVAVMLLVGDRYLAAVGRRDSARVSLAVLALLVLLSALFAGLLGLGAFLAATLVGLLPPRTGARRVHLMGVLIVPLAL